jgi:hypothetical protein
MPEICRFYGIVIKMYFADHAPPHFHAEYAEHEARIAIDSLAVLSGKLLSRAMGLVAEWARSIRRNCRDSGDARAGWRRLAVLTHCRSDRQRHNMAMESSAFSIMPTSAGWRRGSLPARWPDKSPMLRGISVALFNWMAVERRRPCRSLALKMSAV